MRGLLSYFRHSVALRLGITILFFVMLVLSMSLGYLYVRSRKLVKTEVIERALKELEKTDLQVTDYLNEAEAATKDIEWQVMRHLVPDSLLSYTHRLVALNPDINGCSITMEPDFFPPSIGRFSAYSVRRGDSIITEREADYDYHEKIWYKMPKTTGKACWVDPYNDYTEGTLYNEDMIASYSKPLYNKEGHMIGVISTDLSLNWISSVLNKEKPYPDSYYIMLGHDGRYFVHPDHQLIVNKTIYEGVDAKEHSDIIVLGHEMQSGERDYMEVNFDGEPCYVFYQPLEETGWSLALVCPENDIMGGYNRLGGIILIVIVVGMVIILIFWMRFMSHFISPLTQLVKQSHDIASGRFNEPMSKTERRDLVGQLQNSFAAMQESLAEHIAQLQQVHDDTEKRNQQLLQAKQLAEESLKVKQQFIQDVSHQIRTPLNIIQGFFMVLGDPEHQVPAEQQHEMTDTMKQNMITLRRMVNMLIDAAWLVSNGTLQCNDQVSCNAVAREAVNAFLKKTPYNVPSEFHTAIPDELEIRTDREHLFSILRELLFNSKKYAPEGMVTLTIEQTADEVSFTVEDHGPGIPEEARPHIFTPFMKLDSFSDGLGLGLPLSSRFAEKMGGQLTLDDTYTAGCRFVLKLPK